MWNRFKQWIARGIARYDAWCQSLGLTPENKRSCVPYRRDPASDPEMTCTSKSNDDH